MYHMILIWVSDGGFGVSIVALFKDIIGEHEQ